MSNFFQLRQKLEEKTLTAGEKKKREEVAKAIERENPGMPMAKKMAIATATAKKVAEEQSYTGKGNHRPGWMLKADPALAKKFKEKRDVYNAKVKAYGNPAAGKSVKEETEQIDELKKSTITSYINKTVDPVYGIPKGGKEKIQKRLAGLTRAHQRIVGHKPMTKEEVEQADEAQFWGNKELAKQAHAASGSTSIVRGRDAKGVYTATLLRKKGESEHKEVSRVYDTKQG